MHLATFLENGIGFFGDAFVELLAILVVLIDFEAFAVGVLYIAGHKQFHGLASALHASAGVDARAYLENDIVYSQFLAAQAAGAYYGAQSHIGVAVQPLQPHVCHNAVLVDDGNDVGGDTHRHKVEHAFQLGGGDAVADRERLHEFVAHTAARKVGAWIGASFELGVQNGGGLRQLGARLVVVADYEIDAERGGMFDFLVGLYAAVENNHQLDTLVGEFVDAFAGYAIAFVVACGNVEIEFGVEVLQVAENKRHGSAAVHIVVAVHHDALFAAHGAVQALHGSIHARHEKRIVKVAQRRVEEPLGTIDIVDATLYQKIGNRLAVGEATGKFSADALFFHR